MFDSKNIKPTASMCVIAASIVASTYAGRRMIAVAAATASAACEILKQRQSVFLACFFLKAIWVVLLTCFIFFCIAADEVGVVIYVEKSEVCDIKHGGESMLGPLAMLFIFLTAFFEMASVLVCSLTMGAHYFDDGAGPAFPAFTGLAWAFTSSSGAVAEGAVVMSILTFCRQVFSMDRAGAWACFWPCNPLWWVGRIIWYFFESAVAAMTRFKLIMHTYHGGGMLTENTGQLPFEVLQKHLGTAIVSEMVGGSVLPQSTSLLATVLGMGTWMWFDAVEKGGFFAGIGGAANNSQNAVQAQWLILLGPLIMYLYVTYLPKCVVLFMIAFSSFRDTSAIARNKTVNAALAGVFVGCVAALVLRFFVDIIFHSIDGLLYAFALEAETGRPATALSEEFRKMIEEVKQQDQKKEQQAAAPAQNGQAPAQGSMV